MKLFSVILINNLMVKLVHEQLTSQNRGTKSSYRCYMNRGSGEVNSQPGWVGHGFTLHPVPPATKYQFPWQIFNKMMNGSELLHTERIINSHLPSRDVLSQWRHYINLIIKSQRADVRERSIRHTVLWDQPHLPSSPSFSLPDVLCDPTDFIWK